MPNADLRSESSLLPRIPCRLLTPHVSQAYICVLFPSRFMSWCKASIAHRQCCSFSQGIFMMGQHEWLRSPSRKWLFAMTTSMFASSTVYWIHSVVFTFIAIDLLNNSVGACYGGDPNAFSCLVNKLADFHMPTESWLAMFDDILLINVSTVQSTGLVP